MKGVMLGIAPEASLVDITHAIDPQDVLGGALELAACYRYFPSGTIFLAVIDPGVGSVRRAVAVRAGGYTFVAPDNGLLDQVLVECPCTTAVALADERFARPTISRTFEGRDRFAPAAAWLAAGVEITSLGPPVDALVRLAVPEPSIDASGIEGQVLRVDRFGNLISNIGRALWQRGAGDRPTVLVNGHPVPRVTAAYADAPPGELCVLFSSTDHLEIAVNGGSAAERLGAGRGATVRVARGA
jgi:hypothetical protein